MFRLICVDGFGFVAEFPESVHTCCDDSGGTMSDVVGDQS
jgi:hypothetical protein